MYKKYKRDDGNKHYRIQLSLVGKSAQTRVYFGISTLFLANVNPVRKHKLTDFILIKLQSVFKIELQAIVRFSAEY